VFVRTSLRCLLFVLCFVLLLGAASFAFGEVVLKAGSPFKEGHILVEAATKFKELLEERSGGRLQVELQIAQASEEDVNTQCAEGTIDLQFTGGRPVEVFAPQYFFFNAPYVIKDYDHFLRVWNGHLGEEAKKLVLRNGNMLCLGTVYRGFRQMTSLKPIRRPEDLIGLKLRLPVVKTWIAVWESLGVEPVPVPLPELYQALKEGKAEASEGDLPQIYSFKLYEVQKYLGITNHLVGVGWVTMNKNSMEKLSPEDQELVRNCIAEACQWATEKIKSGEDELLAKLRELGMEVIYPDADAIREKAKPAIEKLFAVEWPVTTWEEVLAQ